jgi:hypothetical protein
MKKLKVTHYLQDPSHCAVAACACVTNYYNSEINYQILKKTASRLSSKISKEGLDSAQIGILLNRAGFQKVTIITSVLNHFDYEWANYSKRKLLENIEESFRKKKEKNEIVVLKNFHKWLKNKSFNNKLIINYNFRKYIQKHLNRNKPVIITFNWTMFFKYPKEGENKEKDVFNGSDMEHAVVGYKYDNKGLWVCDSHHSAYKYKLKRFRKGYYKMSWDSLLTCMGQGDVILPEEYQKQKG